MGRTVLVRNTILALAGAVGGALAGTLLDDMPLWWSVRTAVVVFVVLIGASTVLAWWRSRRSER